MSTEARNVVLVHGGFVDGSGWKGVYDLLTADGYTVTVVQNPTLSLDGDVAATKLILDAQDGPTVLVGVLSTPGERCHPFPAVRQNRDKGITQHLRHVVASHSVTIWEMDVTNPVGVPDPCPPTLAWLMIRRNRRVQTLRVVFPQLQR